MTLPDDIVNVLRYVIGYVFCLLVFEAVEFFSCFLERRKKRSEERKLSRGEVNK